MKKLVSLLAMSCMCMTWCFAQTYTIEQYKSKYSGWTVSYAKIVPSGYDQTKAYPLLVAEHGNGEKTWNGSTPAKVEAILKNVSQVGYNVLNSKKNYQMVTIVPVTPFSPSWPTLDGGKTTKFIAGAFLSEIIDTVTKYTKVDLSRIYITGLSEGGADMYDFMTLYANRVAACVPISCWPPLANSTWEKTIADSKTPIWHFQSDNDGAGGSASNVGIYLAKISKLGANTKFTVYTLDGHNMWTFPYRNVQSPTYSSGFNYSPLSSQPTDFYEWLLAQKRTDIEAPADTFVHDTIVIPPVASDTFNGDGWKAIYQVEKKIDSLNVNWGTSAPVVFPSDNWKAAFGGYIRVPKTGEYTFYLTSDDGSRLTINNNEVINHYSNHAATEKVVKINLTAGSKHSIVVDYYDACCAASLSLKWLDENGRKTVIPKRYCYSR